MAFMSKFKNLALMASVWVMANVPGVAYATKATQQAENTKTLADTIVLILMVVLFGGGMIILMLTAWNVGKDYIWAGRQAEEKIGIGKILVGVILGSLLAAPSATFIMGQSIAVGDQDAVQFSGDDFDRPTPSSGG